MRLWARAGAGQHQIYLVPTKASEKQVSSLEPLGCSTTTKAGSRRLQPPRSGLRQNFCTSQKGSSSRGCLGDLPEQNPGSDIPPQSPGCRSASRGAAQSSSGLCQVEHNSIQAPLRAAAFGKLRGRVALNSSRGVRALGCSLQVPVYLLGQDYTHVDTKKIMNPTSRGLWYELHNVVKLIMATQCLWNEP